MVAGSINLLSVQGSGAVSKPSSHVGLNGDGVATLAADLYRDNGLLEEEGYEGGVKCSCDAGDARVGVLTL